VAAEKSVLQLEGGPPTQDAKISANPLIMFFAFESNEARTVPVVESTRKDGVSAAFSKPGDDPEML